MPIIQRRPFPATRRALVDVHKGEVAMRGQDQEIKFSMYNSMKYHAKAEECSEMKVLDEPLIETLSSEVMLEQLDNSWGARLEHDDEDSREVIYLNSEKELTHS